MRLSSHRCHLFSFPAVFLFAGVILFSPSWLPADQDSIESPWGTVHADLSGTAATEGIVYRLGEGPVKVVWTLDPTVPDPNWLGLGGDRPGGRSSLVFDKDGNLYWISSTGGATGGNSRLLSVSPGGVRRWVGNDGAGNLHSLGGPFSGMSPVVGVARVYAAGSSNTDNPGTLMVAAYDKATGKNLWTQSLAPTKVGFNLMLSPVLYQGKLYVVGNDDINLTKIFYQVDAETGAIDWDSFVEEVDIGVLHQMTFVPNAFEAGVHGIYFNGDSGSGTDGRAEVYGIKISNAEATFGWKSEGGKAGRSHVNYSPVTGLLYTPTWSDYGANFYVFDPKTGFLGSHQNSKNTGHGFYDVGCLEFDGKNILAGGFEGYIVRYTDDGAGNITDEIIFKGGTDFPVPWWGESRVLGQLLKDPEGNSVLIAGTNSMQCCASHVYALDITRRKLLFEYDTGNRNDHQFLYAGGPLMGPDGKIYYFGRPAGAPTALVALGPVAEEQPPTAGFVVVRQDGAVHDPAANPPICTKGGEAARFDASCSTGKGLAYRYQVKAPDGSPGGAVILPRAESDPKAEIRLLKVGNYEVTLEVENAQGTASCARSNLCVEKVAPLCQLAVTDSGGGPVDDADDDDGIPCLTAGESLIADGSASPGGDLEYSFSVLPAAGVTIQQGNAENPQATIAIADPGVYQISLDVANDLGASRCDATAVCVKAAPPRGGGQVPGDCNQDGQIDQSDAVCLLSHLFLGSPEFLPCVDGKKESPGNKALLNWNDDQDVDLTDAINLLQWKFLGGPAHFLGQGCTRIVDCPDLCAP
ncbi:MAG: PQQ-binding-like beta-propeller repeat protein [Planctomycetes bacterium]|nr:PQQ-binding-like beta-propeller repeat protein [Planctomycetota bacterium]